MVFQRDSVFPWLRVVDNVEYGLKCRGVASGERREIARDYLRRVGLSHVEQRLAARAFRRNAEAGRHRGGLREWRRGAAPGRAVRRARLCHPPPIPGRAARSLGGARPRRSDRAVRDARCRRGVDACGPDHRHATRARSSTTSPFEQLGRATPTACCCRTWSPSSTSCSAISASNIERAPSRDGAAA